MAGLKFRTEVFDMDFNLRLARVLLLGTCGSRPTREIPPSPLTVNATRLLQPAVPISARFVAPLLPSPI